MSDNVESVLNNLRKEIDLIDDEIVLLLQKRINVIRKISEVKMREKINIHDSNRETEIIDRIAPNIDSDIDNIIRDIYKIIFYKSKQYQTKLIIENNNMELECDKV